MAAGMNGAEKSQVSPTLQPDDTKATRFPGQQAEISPPLFLGRDFVWPPVELAPGRWSHQAALSQHILLLFCAFYDLNCSQNRSKQLCLTRAF